MDEINEKKKIAAAMAEPSAPAELVENMVQRAAAIERGRSCLKQLMNAGPDLSDKDKLLLGASALIGRIAAGSWPKNASSDDLAEQLSENSVFQKAADLPAGELAARISDGSFLKSLQPSHDPEKAYTKKSLSRKGPENGIPII